MEELLDELELLLEELEEELELLLEELEEDEIKLIYELDVKLLDELELLVVSSELELSEDADEELLDSCGSLHLEGMHCPYSSSVNQTLPPPEQLSSSTVILGGSHMGQKPVKTVLFSSTHFAPNSASGTQHCALFVPGVPPHSISSQVLPSYHSSSSSLHESSEVIVHVRPSDPG